MAVQVVDDKTGQVYKGRYAVLQPSAINLYSGCMSDKKGGLRGCGKKTVLPRENMTVAADDPARELKEI